ELDWAHGERSRRMPARYISPEQARGDRLSHQSDLYSLGIVLFEMLTDRLPFNAANSEVIKRKHITQTPLPPYIFSPGVSQPLSEITLKLLDKRPSGRFRDGAALISILRRIYDISPAVAARPAATARRIESPAPVEPQVVGYEQQVEAAPEAEQGHKADGHKAVDEAVDKTAGKVEEETVSEAGIYQEAAVAEEEAMPEPDQAEAPPGEPENRMHYESPVISVIDHPVQQFYETASSPEAVSTASVPLLKEASARTSPARPRSRWRTLFIIAAIPLVAGVIALARSNYLPNIFRFNMAESAPAQNFQPSPDSTQPAAAAETEGEPAGSSPQSEPPAPGPQDGAPPAGQADTPAASQSAAPAAPRVRKAQVRKSVRRSKPKPRRYRAKRRWF
ncbi:MAG TPA: protein kinase, partial [Blastocatellia bacterium]|nr:protein kinase [Blastocatellia bacterium]